MLLSIVIPTFKRPETLNVCLSQLTPEIQNVSPNLFEVIVSDDASGDDLRRLLSRDHPSVLRNPGPQKGPAANRNSGAKAARGEWIVFLDDDCIPQPPLLSAYIEAIKAHPEYLVFEGSTLAERPRMRLDEEAPINDRGGYLWSCNFVIQRKLFFELGGFCELYPYACMEDVDFREQLKEKEIKFLFVPKATVVHPWKFLTKGNRKYLNMRLISHAIFNARYPLQKPSFTATCRTMLHGWAKGLFVEAPRLKFRGFGPYLARQSTRTVVQLLNWARSRGNNPAQRS